MNELKIVSACLAGKECRYNGQANPCQAVIDLVERGKAVAVCPEELGGLSTPREPAEKLGDKYITKTGKDVTEAYKAGGFIALHAALALGCDEAILKARSPACGSNCIYDGSHSGKLINGNGIFASLLKEYGIKVYTEDEFEALRHE